MSFNFEATNDFDSSLANIDTLIQFAKAELVTGNEDNRILFLKLSVVSCVTKFQVFIESILKEYRYHLRTSSKIYKDVPTHLRLNSIKLFSTEKIIHKVLENHETYSDDKLFEVKDIILKTLSFCEDDYITDNNLMFDTKFPMGKTGVGELAKLFRQVNGEDIFESPPFDINKLNEILGRRHAIIHEDSNPQITEDTVEKYKEYLITVMKYIDGYLQTYK